MTFLCDMDIKKQLLLMQDEEYRDFQSRLMPTIPNERIIGVRTPALRAFAKSIATTQMAEDFLHSLPHYYYEENNLHGALICYGKYNFEQTMHLLDQFLPYIDNWATCDMFIPPILKSQPDETLKSVCGWLQSKHPYIIRFALNCLMHFYMEEHFDQNHFKWIEKIDSKDYYVRMGIAWYYSVALVKQWDVAYAYLKSENLDPWIQNKAIQKARESLRMGFEKKGALLALKKK